jgi:tRNA A37 methylthiotransferase MiaB
MDDDVPLALKNRRLQDVLKLQGRITKERRARYLDATVEVLFEGPSRLKRQGQTDEWQLTGRTRSNLIANVPVPVGDFWSNRWVGKLAQVKITELRPNSLYGHLA